MYVLAGSPDMLCQIIFSEDNVVTGFYIATIDAFGKVTGP